MSVDLDLLATCFRSTVTVDQGIPLNKIVYGEVEGWDSLNHMNLVAEIEERFGVMLDTEDVLDMSSFARAREILEKYINAS